MGLGKLEWLESMSLIQIKENKQIYKLQGNGEKSQIGTNWDGSCALLSDR